MTNEYTNRLADVSAILVEVAQGRSFADLVLKNGNLVNVHTGEIIYGCDVAVAAGRIALFGDASHTVGPVTRVVEAGGCFICPGFLDGHIHVESSMVNLTGFAGAVVPRGTTGIFMDPHEIANVLGLEGIRLMHGEGKSVPLRVYTTVPSCVPAAPGLEDAGAVIGPAEVREALTWEGVVGLGEMMNFPGVLANDPAVRAVVNEALLAGKVVTGHYAAPADGPGLSAYMAAGITSCHESVRREDALARMRNGMYAMLREGSAWHDIRETVRALTGHRIDNTYGILCSDDTHPDTLLKVGHLDQVLRRAVEEGLNPVRAIQMATINTARYFRLDHEIGSIAPGKYADILLLTDLARIKVRQVYLAGRLVAEDGRLLVTLPARKYPDFVRQSVRLAAPLGEADFHITAPSPAPRVTVRIIQVEEAQVGTRERLAELTVTDGLVCADPSRDIAKAAVFERHRASGSRSLGFVSGFGFTKGAVAQTVAHDSHNLLIVGTNDTDMAVAGNLLAEHGGGMVAVADGEVLALLELPVAGLMSDRPVEEVAAQVARLTEAWRKLGCTLVSPFMTLALLPLPVIPDLRLTNRGLVDVKSFAPVSLFVS